MAAVFFDPPLRKAHQLGPDALAAQGCCHRNGCDAAKFQWLGKGELLGGHVYRDEANDMASFFGDECLGTFCVNE